MSESNSRRRDNAVSSTLKHLTDDHSAAPTALSAAGFRSAFSIATTPADKFLKESCLSGVPDAQQLYQGATATAVAIARAFRERRLSAAVRHAVGNQSGIRSLVEGPTYEDQFQPSWSSNCVPGALEATTGPIAYLVDLYRKAKLLEAEGVSHQIIPLSKRRPDLETLILDQSAVNQVKPTLVVVNRILESAVSEALQGRDISVDDALLQARYPFVLPFERYQHQINYVLGRKNYALGDIIRWVDIGYPYFVRPGLHTPKSDVALQFDTLLGPVQQEVLIESPYAADVLKASSRVNPRTLLRSTEKALDTIFLKRFYGVDAVAELTRVPDFCRRTGLNQTELESLLSIERCFPTVSPNVPDAPAPTPSRFGSVYINAGSDPFISVRSDETGEMHTLRGLTIDTLDRIQRLIRLARWMELPFDQADQIVCAAMRAERTTDRLWPSENTIRALGLFRRLRRDYGITAEDFAALLDGPSVYARGEALPHFDRIFNSRALFADPFVLDGSPFPIVPESEAQYQKIDQLCSALGITFETYLYLARFIFSSSEAATKVAKKEGAGEPECLSWSHEVLSAFYRLARLPTYLGISAVEAVALLQILGRRGVQFVGRLAAPSLFAAQSSELADTLTVIQALTDTVAWCQAHELSVLWLHQQLTPIAPPAAATERETGLLTEIDSRMRATLISESTFVDAALPQFSGGEASRPIHWMEELSLFISDNGLIKDVSGVAGPEEYESELANYIKSLLERLELTDSETQTKLMSIVLDAKAAQEALVWESLGATFDCSAEQSRELLRWSGGSCFTLLNEVLRVFVFTSAAMSQPSPVIIGDQVLTTLARLSVRAAVTKQLSLSPYALRSYVDHPGWFVPGSDKEEADVSFVLLHALVQYQGIVKTARQGEQPVLDYFYLVNNLPDNLPDESWRMIREDAASKIASFTGFSIREVLETAVSVTDSGIVTTVAQLDQLVRMRHLCDELQLGTRALLDLATLTPLSPIAEFRAAAEGALSALTNAAADQQVSQDGEMGQSESSWIAADKEVIVAQSDQQVRFTLTVRDFLGRPAPNIDVTWQTSLGQLGSPDAERTDENGQVSISLSAEDRMGTAQVVARFGLDRRIMAPPVLIDCEEATLVFLALPDTPNQEEALAGNLEQIEFGVRLIDDYDNVGRDRIIQWSTDLESSSFVRPLTRTDEEGKTYASLRGLSAGSATVTVAFPGNGNSHSFAPVTFVDRPWFRYLRPARQLVQGEAIEVSAQLVKLDGTPVVGESVEFKTTPANGAFTPASEKTDASGVARTQYTAETAGSVTLNCAAGEAEFSTNVLTVLEKPSIIDYSPEEEIVHAIGQIESSKFSVTLAPAVSRMAVEWWKGGTRLDTNYTDADGVAKYEHHFRRADLGKQMIQARTISVNADHEFKVRVTEAHDQVTLESLTPNTMFSYDIRQVIDRGFISTLKIRAFRDGNNGPIGDENAVFTLSLASSSLDPNLRDIVFDPPIGQPFKAVEGGYATLNIDCTNTIFPERRQSNEFYLILTTNLGIEKEITLWPRDFLADEQTELYVHSGRHYGRLALKNPAPRKDYTYSGYFSKGTTLYGTVSDMRYVDNGLEFEFDYIVGGDKKSYFYLKQQDMLLTILNKYYSNPNLWEFKTKDYN
ncbi:Tc toxin subunit A [Mycetohabitans rhizoxinica]|uniref:Ig-like domain-containing protein n=1 Tax=Mycetohabitans rhizoxinica TaxID=412963 RepID=A0ABZ2PSI7_9BURK